MQTYSAGKIIGDFFIFLIILQKILEFLIFPVADSTDSDSK